ELLPTQKAFFDQHLVNRRQIEPMTDDLFEFFDVVGDTAPGSAHGKTRPDNERKIADVVRRFPRLLHAFDGRGTGDVETDLFHRLLEELAVLPLLDRVRFGP